MYAAQAKQDTAKISCGLGARPKIAQLVAADPRVYITKPSFSSGEKMVFLHIQVKT
jgi:hypothetical protein